MDHYFRIIEGNALYLSDVKIDVQFWRDMEDQLKIAKSRIKPFVWKKYLMGNEVYKRSVQINVLQALLKVGLPVDVEKMEEVTRKITQDSTMGKMLAEQVRDLVIKYHECRPEQAQTLISCFEAQNQKDLEAQIQVSRGAPPEGQHDAAGQDALVPNGAHGQNFGSYTRSGPVQKNSRYGVVQTFSGKLSSGEIYLDDNDLRTLLKALVKECVEMKDHNVDLKRKCQSFVRYRN